jgi:hypothetical protein
MVKKKKKNGSWKSCKSRSKDQFDSGGAFEVATFFNFAEFQFDQLLVWSNLYSIGFIHTRGQRYRTLRIRNLRTP